MIARVLLAGVALALGVAMAVWLGASRAEREANAVAYGPERATTRADIERGLRAAQRARRLGPDVPGRLLEAQLLFRSGRRAAAERRLVQAVRAEPDNVGAWFLLAAITRDPRRSESARQAVRRLNPQLAGRGR